MPTDEIIMAIDGKTHHIVVTHDDGDIRWYLDGEPPKAMGEVAHYAHTLTADRIRVHADAAGITVYVREGTYTGPIDLSAQLVKRCVDCGKLVQPDGATEHAANTGHYPDGSPLVLHQ